MCFSVCEFSLVSAGAGVFELLKPLSIKNRGVLFQRPQGPQLEGARQASVYPSAHGSEDTASGGAVRIKGAGAKRVSSAWDAV